MKEQWRKLAQEMSLGVSGCGVSPCVFFYVSFSLILTHSFSFRCYYCQWSMEWIVWQGNHKGNWDVMPVVCIFFPYFVSFIITNTGTATMTMMTTGTKGQQKKAQETSTMSQAVVFFFCSFLLLLLPPTYKNCPVTARIFMCSLLLLMLDSTTSK